LINEDSFFLVKEWKAGKRRAERDDLVGAAFFLTVQSPQGLVLEDSDATVENFGKFSRQMDESLITLRDRMASHCEKCSGRKCIVVGVKQMHTGNCMYSVA
jgi:hypothetical protein